MQFECATVPIISFGFLDRSFLIMQEKLYFIKDDYLSNLIANLVSWNILWLVPKVVFWY